MAGNIAFSAETLGNFSRLRAKPAHLVGHFPRVAQRAALFHEVAPGMFTLLFTLHPELPWLVMGGLMLSASSTIFGIEPYQGFTPESCRHI